MSSIQRTRGRLAATLTTAAIAAAATLGLAAPAQAAPNVDTDREGSIVVHKFEQPATPGTASTGGTVDTTGLTPLEGVTFRARLVQGVDLSTNAGWAAAADLTVADVLAAGSATPAAATGSSATTASTGTATIADLPIGVYLVEETSAGANPVAIPAQPFLVSIPLPDGGDWRYDVNVYPKNALTGISLAVDDSAAFGLGDAVTLTIDTTVPRRTEGNTIDSYVITDQLDPRLAYTGATVSLGGTALTESVDGGPGDFVLTHVDGLVTVTFTPAGLAKLNAAGGEVVRVVVGTTVEALGDGTIVNEAKLFINDAPQASAFVSNDEQTLWGAVRIVKRAEGDVDSRLSGAVFEVYNAAGDLVTVDGETRFTTGADGQVVIPGLKAGEYELLEVEAPLGYILDETRHAVTVVAGAEADATVATVTNVQVPPFALPITGGDGQVAFLLGGGALLAVALGAILVAGRRRAAQHQG